MSLENIHWGDGFANYNSCWLYILNRRSLLLWSARDLRLKAGRKNAGFYHLLILKSIVFGKWQSIVLIVSCCMHNT